MLPIGGYTLKGTHYFARQNGRKFSTSDRDQDGHSSSHCAATYSAGWWYYYYCSSEPNINRQPPFFRSSVLFTYAQKIAYLCN